VALVEEHAPDVLILDSLRTLAPGLDENDSMQAEAALRPIVRMTQARELATMILHHASRSSGEYRGSTALGAAVELGFTLTRHEDDPNAATRRKLACWKSRPAAEPPPRWLTIEPVDGGGILLGEAAAFEPHAAAREDAEDALLAALTGPMAWPAWASAASLDSKNGTARRARDRLAERGRVKRDEADAWTVVA
jgi:AAA domain